MKAGEFIARSTYCIFARAEKKPCSNCGWKHQCKCYYVPTSLSDWLLTSQPAVSGEADPFLIGSAVSCDQAACTNLNYQENCCVKSFLHPLVTLRCDKHSRNILDAFRPHLHLPQSTGELELPELLGLVFLLTRICKGLWAQLPRRSITPTFICSVSFRLCATSLFVTSAAHHAGAQTAFLIVVFPSLIIRSMARVRIIYVIMMSQNQSRKTPRSFLTWNGKTKPNKTWQIASSNPNVNVGFSDASCFQSK